MLKNRQFNTLIVEGPDCELKQQFIEKLHDYFQGQYLVITHGDLYEQVYALKHNIVPTRHTHGMQVKYILFDIEQDNEEYMKELSLYKKVVKKLPASEYDIVNIAKKDTLNETVGDIGFRISFENSIRSDEEFNKFNLMYKTGCEKYRLNWKVVDDQPYLNDRQIMADYQYHNGSYETYTDKSIPDTLLYSAAYTNTKSCHIADFMKKKYDVQYPINSKIKYRPDAQDYIKAIIKSLTLYTSKSSYVDEIVSDCTNEEKAKIHTFDKVFCDDYIKELSQAKTTIITNREFAHTEMMTARWYEAVLANCVIFVDEQTDPESKVLKQIYGKNSMFIQMLTVTPETYVDSVKQIISAPTEYQSIEEILNAQHAWYNRLLNDIDSKHISFICGY